MAGLARDLVRPLEVEVPIEAERNLLSPGNVIVVRDTETLERFEVYLLGVPSTGTTRSVLALVENRGLRLMGRSDPDLEQTTTIWRCWTHQVSTPRWDALYADLRRNGVIQVSIEQVIGNRSDYDYASAIACDMVDAFRVHVQKRAPLEHPQPLESQEPERVSRYHREPVI